MPKTRVNGLDLFHELDPGTGVPVVLISGLTSDHTAWLPQLPDLRTAGYRCLAFDNRDVGQTSQSDAPYPISTMAADTAALMDALGLGAAHVVGASMGGMIAQELAVAHPDRVLSLTLVCTMARSDTPLKAIASAWSQLRPPLSPQELLTTIAPSLFTYRFFERPEPLQSVMDMVRDNPYPQSPEGFRRQCAAIGGHDCATRLGALKVPTHVLVGAEDVLTPPRYSHELAGLIPGATLSVLPAAGHCFFWECIPEFNAAVIGFLDRQHVAV